MVSAWDSCTMLAMGTGSSLEWNEESAQFRAQFLIRAEMVAGVVGRQWTRSITPSQSQPTRRRRRPQ